MGVVAAVLVYIGLGGLLRVGNVVECVLPVAVVLMCVGLLGLLRVGSVFEFVVSDGLSGLLRYYPE